MASKNNALAAARAFGFVIAGSFLASCGGAGGGAPGAPTPPLHDDEHVASAGTSSARTVVVPYQPGTTPSLVSFKTLPGARCQLAGDTSSVPWNVVADPNGNASFTVTIAADNSPKATLTCTAGASSQSIALSYQATTAHVASAVSAPVAMPSESQIANVISSLGFDPRTATRDTLVAHNLPPRPDDYATNPAGSVGWLKAVFTPTTSLITTPAGVAQTGVYFVPPNSVGGSRAVIENGSNVSTTFGNWSGFDAAGQQGTFNTIRAYWTVPALSPGNANPAYSGLWVGIDEGPCASNPVSCSGTLFQDGTSQNYSSSGGVNYYSYEGWWEDYPNNAEQVVFSVNPGDEIYGTVWKNTSGTPYHAQYYLKDLNTGATTNFAITIGSGFVGNSAEWIMEAPNVNGSTSHLADYGTAEMTQASLISGTTTMNYDQWPVQSSYDLYDITMEDSNAYSYAAEAGTGNIDFTWQGI